MESIDRVARVLVQNYGHLALKEAAKRSDELHEKGDIDRSQEWSKVHLAVKERLKETYSGRPIA